ncbi:MAG: hypothetical protein ABF633_02960 [Clostridium sp.]|uniref:hypothetical protein n=1 Tax=Clostridium sp. TaxID=1506 RepID=UPI0039E98A75
MKYKVGDEVYIKKDLMAGEIYEDYYFVTEMSNYVGQKAVIKKVVDDGYKLDIDNSKYIFTNKMLTKNPLLYSTSEILVELKKDHHKTFKLVKGSGYGNDFLINTIASNEIEHFILRNNKGMKMDLNYFDLALFEGIWIEIKKEYMTFIEAIKTGAKFKYKSWDNYDTLEEAIYDLSNLSNEQIGEMIKEKAWEVQE